MQQTERTIINAGPMLNAYPDSMGGTLKDIIDLLQTPDFEKVFQALYVLPSIFNTDLDRGFSVIDYELNDLYATRDDLDSIQKMNMVLKLDFILNHASVLSKQFQDILLHGEKSIYKDFFINWNKFWQGYGSMTEEGYIQPDEEWIKNMFFRKPGLPILNVRMPDGKEVPYWNTFYQEVKYSKIGVQQLMRTMNIQYGMAERLAGRVNASLQEGKLPKELDFSGMEHYRNQVIELLEESREYLGQMDLNIKSPLVWEFYEDTLKKLKGYGAEIVRLDAFAYAPKEPGEKNFLNDPGTWDLLKRIKGLADQYELTLLPEIHSKYEEKIHEKLAQEGYMTYDFFLPGLIIDALDRHNSQYLLQWANELQDKKIHVVNMLGCHDGIPLLDLKGLIPDETIEDLIHTVVARGGYVKDLHGKKNVYYQVNATYYSALGEDDKKLLLARAIQMFMPGKPQVWYLDLFAGKNDYEAVKRAGAAGHKEINRTNLSPETIEEDLKQEIVQQQLSLLRFRNQCPAFGFDAKLMVFDTDPHKIRLQWENQGFQATLEADLTTYQFRILTTDPNLPESQSAFPTSIC